MGSMSTPQQAADETDLSGLIPRAATLFGDRCAVVENGSALSYRELRDRVTDVSTALRAHGIGPGTIVGVHLPRSIEATVAIHAVLATGAVVAPLDPNDPAPRLAAIVENTGVAHLLSRARATTSPPRGQLPTIALPFDLTLASTACTPAPDLPESAYLLFTSGSTGTPKGVLLSGAAVAHFARWAAARLGLRAEDRIAAQSALTFDLSTFDLFACAYAGAAQVVVPEWLKAFPADLAAWLDAHAVTTIYAVPTLLRALTDHLRPTADGAALRVIAYAGEPYPAGALSDLLRTLPEVAVHNLYGPTETNVCTAEPITADWTPDRAVAIGRPIDGMHAVPVDAASAPCDEGELVVAGPQLLTGYLSAGVLTDPTVAVRFPDGVVRRSYRTGDLVRRDEDGRLYLLGRADSQIKRRGHRIELDGIAAIACAADGVRAAAAITVGTPPRIVLFLETRHEDPDLCRRRALDTLGARLPATHHPDDIVCMPDLPVNARGKVDRSRLAQFADIGGPPPTG